jgi:putative photosynthetic complex assembly protein
MNPSHTAQARAAAPERIPAAMVRGIGLLLALLLLGLAWVRLGGFDPQVAPAPPLAERQLVFADAADGAVTVSEGSERVATLHGEQGFLRGVLRGLARERRARGVAATLPYTLSLHADGRLLISDPHTGQRIDLASFGPDNAAVFLRWMPPSALQTLHAMQTRSEKLP